MSIFWAIIQNIATYNHFFTRFAISFITIRTWATIWGKIIQNNIIKTRISWNCTTPHYWLSIILISRNFCYMVVIGTSMKQNKFKYFFRTKISWNCTTRSISTGQYLTWISSTFLVHFFSLTYRIHLDTYILHWNHNLS